MLAWVALLWILTVAKARSGPSRTGKPISPAISVKRATQANVKINTTLEARGRRAAGCVARWLQPAAGMRLARFLPSALLPLRATHSSIQHDS